WLHTAKWDIPTRLSGHPERDLADRLRLPRREPGRRPDLRVARPEDQPDMSAQATAAARVMMPRRRLIPARWRNPIGMVGAIIVGLTILVALFGRFLWTTDPDAPDAERFLGPSWAHPFGTDNLGRDTLARVIHGAHISLEVGMVAI